MSQFERFDLCVIGAGPAGLAAAQKGVALGARVALIEAGAFGGTALSSGALPAQALCASARLAHDMADAARLGLQAVEPRANFARINAHVNAAVAARRPQATPERLAAMGIDVIAERATFIDKATIRAGERLLRARRYIVATGARPLIPDVPGIESVPYLTPWTIFELTRRPAHLIVVGGGAVGTMLAQAHLRLGCAVTLIDLLEPLGNEDAEFSAIVLGRLEAEGMRILANTGLVSVFGDDGHITIEVKSGAEEHSVVGSHILFAQGTRPDFDDLGFEAARIRMDGQRARLDRFNRTSNRKVYCVGDCTGDIPSVHMAQVQAERAVAHALGLGLSLLPAPIVPRVVDTDPQIVQVGMSEAQARQRYKDNIEISRIGFSGLDRAMATGRPEGHIKIITRTGGRLIGAGVCGENGGEIAGTLALAISQKLSVLDLEGCMTPYPALGEIVPLAARAHLEAFPVSRGKRWLHVLNRLLP